MDHNANDLGSGVFFVDILCTVLAFLAAFWLREFVPVLEEEPLDLYSHVFLIPLLLALTISLLSYFGAYQGPNRKNYGAYFWAVAKTVFVTVATLLSLLFFLKIEYVSRFVILIFAVLELVVLSTIRGVAIRIFKDQVRSGKNKLRVLIVGTRSRAQDLVKALQQQVVWGVQVVGFIDPDPACLGQKIFGVPVIGTVENMHECLKNNVFDEVIVAIPRSLLDDAEPIVMACEEEGVRLRFMADVFNVQVARMSLSQVQGIPLLTMEPVAQDPQQLLAKRLFDLILTILALPFLVPLFLVVALAIKLDSSGPVFFVQQRVGLRKRLFPMYKFRSMYVGAEEKLKEIEHLNEAEGPIFKIRDDPRVTRVGRFLRRTSIDELPQLINVLRGEMSLVGPRPMSQRDVELFDRGVQRKRFSVQPGLTCLWQISGRSDLPFEKWLELDLEYIANWSFWLDIKILFKTIPVVLKSKGAV
ncbi:sugar transferase [Desulfobulbus elongatus]|uniref:sugar transferase n=1 Tax=Desulfobulbus elongatus TaxID=53332 RepID=UPI001FDF4BE5|nr:sugar transferase [Desulfobulbus elongatus]